MVRSIQAKLTEWFPSRFLQVFWPSHRLTNTLIGLHWEEERSKHFSRHLLVRGQCHEHGVIPHICDIQLRHVILLKKNIFGLTVKHPTSQPTLYFPSRNVNLLNGSALCLACKRATWIFRNCLLLKAKSSYVILTRTGNWLVQGDWPIPVKRDFFHICWNFGLPNKYECPLW